ncbi:MAG: hypothetical protein ACFFDN_36975 [Candidatus Hodarchaeota archaeon]
MKTNILSRKFGWYLARINASVENFANIVFMSYKTMQRFKLQPGRNVKISNSIKSHSRIEFFDKFVLLPYYKEFIRNYWLLHDVIQSITNTTYRYIDKEYIAGIIKIMSSFYQNRGDKRGLVIKELLEFDSPENFQMAIAMPEYWLNQNSVDLGDTVLLRNDEPSPVIL